MSSLTLLLAISVAVLFIAHHLPVAAGHGSVVYPPPRNGIDRTLSPWSGSPPTQPPPSVETKTGWCPVPARNGTVTGQNGQACFWFSNGCAIGCTECDGDSRGPIPNEGPQWRRKFPVCDNNKARATVCDPALRTVNRNASCGADDDWYYYSPWRAPGSAPVFDSCGMAGGHHPPDGGFGGIYVNTTFAKLGDAGTKVLPRFDTGVTWAPGDVVEVSWTIEANHGGGYQYRLAPAEGPLTETVFQKTPLAFVGKQALRWGGVGGDVLRFDGTYVTQGTTPAGSAWAMNPIPRNDYKQTGQGFTPKCNTSEKRCQGMEDGSSADPTLEIVDYVQIPADLPEGAYVLGWRWDCEESNQIWQSCSDITIARH